MIVHQLLEQQRVEQAKYVERTIGLLKTELHLFVIKWYFGPLTLIICVTGYLMGRLDFMEISVSFVTLSASNVAILAVRSARRQEVMSLLQRTPAVEP